MHSAEQKGLDNNQVRVSHPCHIGCRQSYNISGLYPLLQPEWQYIKSSPLVTARVTIYQVFTPCYSQSDNISGLFLLLQPEWQYIRSFPFVTARVTIYQVFSFVTARVTIYQVFSFVTARVTICQLFTPLLPPELQYIRSLPLVTARVKIYQGFTSCYRHC